jgi:exonuclease VII large subunit
MADWDKAAEQIEAAAALMQKIEARCDRIIELQQQNLAILNRMLSRPAVGNDDEARRRALDLTKSRLLADTVSDVGELRVRQIEDRMQVAELEHRLQLVEQRLTALEKRQDQGR